MIAWVLKEVHHELFRNLPHRLSQHSIQLENNFVFLGIFALVDPARVSARCLKLMEIADHHIHRSHFRSCWESKEVSDFRVDLVAFEELLLEQAVLLEVWRIEEKKALEVRHIPILLKYLIEDSFKVFGNGGYVHSWVLCLPLEIRAHLAQIYKAVIRKKGRDGRLLQLGVMHFFKFSICSGDEGLVTAETVIDELPCMHIFLIATGKGLDILLQLFCSYLGEEVVELVLALWV